MGIQKESVAFIEAMKLPKGFTVCELGDQGLCGLPVKRLAKEWYEELGCGTYVSIDGNGRGTMTADLNAPLPKMKPSQFDLVTDFGTGEHIFDQAQIWRTLHSLCKPGGYLAFDRPTQGYAKHCFYLVNECLLRDLAQANNYRVLWLEKTPTPRGEMIRGVFQRQTDAPFRVPQQGKYQSILRIPQ